jgi:hypothetical protein
MPILHRMRIVAVEWGLRGLGCVAPNTCFSAIAKAIVRDT